MINKPVSLFVFFSTFLCIIIAVPTKGCWSGGWTINVINEINNPDRVQVHCKSKDDDIGMKEIGFHQSVDWKFCENIIAPSTLFFCHVYKGKQEQVFDVFNHTIKPLCREQDRSKDYWRCSWLIQADGIYFIDRRDGGEKIIKMHDWKNIGRVI
ncbi:hypothetical protein L1987_86477 [Smallanthus sonchifolius]|uniref:Uncharacterized protein n=1 Tax=Smallanthus sonchifolius TaxID=185202 RepID=A0ACB8Y0B0_9ASTR|nr:hypothetical protein L1987_86477 [Smallanthus sonchifolius]